MTLVSRCSVQTSYSAESLTHSTWVKWLSIKLDSLWLWPHDQVSWVHSSLFWPIAYDTFTRKGYNSSYLPEHHEYNLNHEINSEQRTWELDLTSEFIWSMPLSLLVRQLKPWNKWLVQVHRSEPRADHLILSPVPVKWAHCLHQPDPSGIVT